MGRTGQRVAKRSGRKSTVQTTVAEPPARTKERTRWPIAYRLELGSRPLLSATEQLRRDQKLLTRIKRRLPALRALLKEATAFRCYEDAVYRFYHQSFKVYGLQDVTLRMVAALQALAPDTPLNRTFVEIVSQGADKKWENGDDRRWTHETRPILEAYLHARYFLEMACRYGAKMKRAENMLPSGWAALLYLYDWR